MTLVPNTKPIDCEVRTLLTQQQYESLKDFFASQAEAKGEDTEETRYFEGEHDLRIQRNATSAKVWLRQAGKLGDDRKEISIKVAAPKFNDFAELFETLGYKTAIVWKRHRMSFLWEGITVSLDDTKGFGQVVELKKSCDAEWRLETMDILRTRLSKIGLKPTPKPVLHERFSVYRENWRELIADKVEVKEEKALPAAIAITVVKDEAPAEKPVEVAVEAPVATEEQVAVVLEPVVEVVAAVEETPSEAPVLETPVLSEVPAEEKQLENAPA
jgi:adenylate cyclase class IV